MVRNQQTNPFALQTQDKVLNLRDGDGVYPGKRFVKKDEWPPNSPDLNPLDYHVWGAMPERYKVFTPKPTNKAELKTVLEAIWEDLSQEAGDLAVLAFRKRLQACIRADGGHFEHLLK